MSKKAEILSPAGSFEALRAAVANGADAVYLGYGDFNARRQAKNFTASELAEACEFCHRRGVKVYVTVNTLVNDREMSAVEKIVRDINRAGADAAIVADLGVARLIREVCPHLPIHASTQMTVHNLDGVKKLAELGFSRVVLARELSREEIKKICEESPVELEVFVHGALCMCYSGQCEMSAVIGKRSGNRGLCAQPCRMNYKLGERGGEAYPLSLKDLCLADYITELSDMGVASLKIEGRMKRAEYVAVVTGIYSDILRDKRCATASEKKKLADIFSREGFTDGYYTNNKGRAMFGIRTETKAPESLLAEAAATYTDVPVPEVKVDFFCIIEEGRPALLAVSDEKGNRAMAQGALPEPARNFPLTEEAVRVQLEKTGGTRFGVGRVNIKVSENLSLPLSALNAMRRECLDTLEKNYAMERDMTEGEFNVGFKLINRKEPPKYTVSVRNIKQISRDLLEREPACIYIPLQEFDGNEERISEIMEKVPVVAAFPRIIKDSEFHEIKRLAHIARECGVKEASVGNLGHIDLASKFDFSLRGDFGINIT
ncbi:MAG: U32 family peptidase, partial [Oscillospiraceae bacterium]|nr:U32 family peptidase [Oscillospiraceae bacterium]